MNEQEVYDLGVEDCRRQLESLKEYLLEEGK